MKFKISILTAALIFSACQTSNSIDQVVSQTFVHKYGFEVAEKDWEERAQDGQVVSTLKTGVKVCNSYENGKLHGLTTYSFPHSPVIEKQQLFDEGILLKEQLNDAAGMPIREEVYEFDNRAIITLWDDKGTPLSIEEYDDEILIEGKYYTPDHELEATVLRGNGERIKRDRTGLLISRDEMREGQMFCRTTFHPNGNVHTVSHYENYQLHGQQTKFTSSGKPLMELNWDHGVLDGLKIIYRNGQKIAMIPYMQGQKHGTELHYDDLGFLTAEIEWRHDKKHGPTLLHTEDSTDTEWFFKGQSVNAERYKLLETRDQIASEFRDQAVQ
jgi:antitoxin component YwqK of YwqJK toxin-antitoxin module